MKAHLIVKYLDEKAKTTEHDVAISRMRAIHSKYRAKSRVLSETEETGRIEVVTLADELDLSKALAEYNASSDVEYAEPNTTFRIKSVPNDARFSELYGMNKIQAPAAWDTRTDATGSLIAVVDTGMNLTHEDLAPNYVGYGFNAITGQSGPTAANDDNGHGSHVSGTIGARGNNGVGVAGVAWTARLLPVKILDNNGSGTLDSVVSGLDYARTQGATVVSASWGWNPGVFPGQSLADALSRLNSAGIAFINAAGNSANDNDATPTYPGSFLYPNEVVVSATDVNDNLASFSNFGRWGVDLAAPGVNVLSSYIGSNSSYTTLSGTSMATPHVSGVYAMLRDQFPFESMSEIIDRVHFSTDQLTQGAGNSLSGGRANLYRGFGDRPKLGNLSTRAFVGTGSNVTIAGIIVTGVGTKRIAVRAQGPTLANFGIANYLPNPTITIYSGSTVIASNDNWITLPPSDRQELINSGLAPSNSLESAWVGNLGVGAYTVIMSGVGDVTGVGLIEAFDFGGDSTARFYNVSTRASVGTGEAQTIAGLIINGDKPRTVMIRGLGPSMTLLSSVYNYVAEFSATTTTKAYEVEDPGTNLIECLFPGHTRSFFLSADK